MNIKFLLLVITASLSLSLIGIEINNKGAAYSIEQIQNLIKNGSKAHELIAMGCDKHTVAEAFRAGGPALFRNPATSDFKSSEVIQRVPAREEAAFIVSKKNPVITARNVSFALGIATTAWATYAARQVAKNIPQEDWDKLSLLQKCRLVATKTLPKMRSQAKRVAALCVSRFK